MLLSKSLFCFCVGTQRKTGGIEVAKRAPCVISYECIMCGICLTKCNLGAIRREDLQYVIDPEACTGCALCTKACPAEAIIQAEKQSA